MGNRFRHRRKQAVTKTHSAAIKFKIQHNAATSPLLRLPGEVRERILIHTIGGSLIHVKTFHFGELLKKGFSRTENSAFRHAICVATQSEQTAYEEAVSRKAVVPSYDSPLFFVEKCQARHAMCSMCGDEPLPLAHHANRIPTVSLTVLGTSRQLYEEATFLLWTTNIFSFDDHESFQCFLWSLTPAQKTKLKSLHISTDIGDQAKSRNEYTPNFHNWGYALTTANVKSLHGLRNLYLCFEQRFGTSYSNGDQYNFAKQYQDVDMVPFLRMRALPLTLVTVTLSDDVFSILKKKLGDVRWTAATKNEYAEKIRTQILDPHGAEIVRAEIDAKMARYRRKREEDKGHTLALLEEEAVKAKTKADDAKVKATQRAQRADKAEAGADVAVAKAEQARAEGSARADELRAKAEWSIQNADFVRGKAVETEVWADEMSILAEQKVAQWELAKLETASLVVAERVEREDVVEGEGYEQTDMHDVMD